MKTYKHKFSNFIVQKNLNGDYSFQYSKKQPLPKELVENTNDWILILPKPSKESIFKIFIKSIKNY